MVYLTRKEHFNAAHRLINPQLSDAENEKVFGKCAGSNFHGHNYDLFVTVKGVPAADTGFLIDAHKLSKLINEKVIDLLDHKNLNLDVPFMKGIIPSTENLIIAIWNLLEPYLKTEHCTLYSIKLQETETIYAEYYGPDIQSNT